MNVDSVNVKKEIEKAVVNLITKKSFYGHMLIQLNKIFITTENHPINTMAVGKRRDDVIINLYVNEEFTRNLFRNALKDSDNERDGIKKAYDQVNAILEHEVLHLALNHLSLTLSDKLRANIACDCVVNSFIERERLPEGCITPEKYNFPPHESAIWYYTKLKDNKEFQDQCASGAFGEGGLLSDAVGSHSIWEQASEDPILEEYVKDMIRHAKDLCGQNYGDIPGELLDQLTDILKTKKQIVPWQKILRTFCASSTESNLDYTMKKRSKRFRSRPGTRKEDVLNLAVAVDTSGSISNDELVTFFNEIKWIWKNGAMITVYEADADIADVYKYKGKFRGSVSGRGGTDLEPVLKEVEGKYDALIYFTDFYAPNISRRYRIPSLWVLTSDMEKSQFPYPWGKHIKIGDGKAMPV